MSGNPYVLAVTGLAREARLASGPGVEAVGTGGNPRRLRALLEGRSPAGCRAVVSFGIAGGLDPILEPGDMIVATGIVADAERWTTAPVLSSALCARLEGAGLRVVAADLAGVEEAVLTVAAKAALRAMGGTAAVDMESHVAAAYAARHGLPFAAVRAVCDPAGRALPAFVAQALKPDGEPDILAVLKAVARGRARIGDLVGLARDSSAAFRALGRCRRRLGDGFGIP